MKIDEIEDCEKLYRVVRKSSPDAFINGKPTAALFIDSNGLSVDRDGDRDEKDIIDSFVTRFGKRNDYGNAVKISAGDCRKIGTYPNPINNHKNRYHAEIHDSQDIVEISLLKAIQLANMCTVVTT